MPSVDVVVPCYQYGRYLKDCVTSILAQNVQDLRVLIIDNASTDNSVEVAQALASTDARVHVMARETNLGATVSYNDGVKWASADYLMILDADDLMAPGCLQHAIAIMEADPEIAFTYGVELRLSFDQGVIPAVPHVSKPHWEVSSGREFLKALCRRPICHVGATSVVRRTSAQKKVGLYRPELPYADDFEMWLRLATVGKVARTNAVQGIRRMHQARSSVDLDEDPVRDFIERQAVYESFFAHEGAALPNAPRLLRQVKHALAGQAYWSGVSHVLRRKPRIGWQLLKYSWQRSPWVVVVPPIGYFLLMERPVRRLVDVVLESVTGRPHGHWLRT
jgi:glycosyltransferase involved in cell wall biosynthesis